MRDSDTKAFRRWLVAGAVWNMISGLPLAVPELDSNYFKSMDKLNSILKLGGEPIRQPADGLHRLFFNLNGILVSAMGAMLLYASRDPRNRSGIVLINAVTRLISVPVFLYYGIAKKMSRVVVCFAATDVLFALAYLRHMSRNRGS